MFGTQTVEDFQLFIDKLAAIEFSVTTGAVECFQCHTILDVYSALRNGEALCSERCPDFDCQLRLILPNVQI